MRFTKSRTAAPTVVRLQAIGLTILLVVMVSIGLGSMLAGDYFAHLIDHEVPDVILGFRHCCCSGGELDCRGGSAGSDFCGSLLLGAGLRHAVALDYARRSDRHRGLDGGIVRLPAVPALFQYLQRHVGLLGAVVILLMWFYITGLMLLFGAEVNSQIEAAAAERSLELHDSGSTGVHAQAVSGSRS